ncbi:MAG: 1-acyl-sn-glycerol-3-phosphate acyltransferase [Gammaproteobacteria bacterium]|nr:1-acyl-sn-glycerol-3-phosphate acyltransferase [Gammaproteobacteria bacterium]
MSSKPVLFVRSLLFWAGFIINVMVFGLLIVFLFFTPSSFRLKVARLWSYSNNFLLKVFCGIDFKVEGKENLNVETAIILCKHQSTWETLALHSFTPYVRWVFKRELMRIPVFGWALALTDPIAIDRGAGRVAIKQLITEGTKKLNAGKWMVMFPEGTRTQPGKTKKYKIGGALLAEKSGYPVIPIAHNAGEFWPRHSFIKWPGTISVVIGPVIETTGRSAEEINAEVFNWIENTMKDISDESRWNRK